MFLSRVEIASGDFKKMRGLTHLGAYHDWVERSFPEEIAQGLRLRHLWRIDRLANRDYLLVVSERKPDLELMERHGVQGSAMTKNYDFFLDTLTLGRIYRFRLTANPTYAVVQPGQKSSKVYPHITADQQRRWLLERQEKLGFEFLKQETSLGMQPSFEIVERDWKNLKRKQGRRNIKLSCVSFEGALKITDVDKFRVALTEGIGREKAFGMGLLTAIPLGE